MFTNEHLLLISEFHEISCAYVALVLRTIVRHVSFALTVYWSQSAAVSARLACPATMSKMDEWAMPARKRDSNRGRMVRRFMRFNTLLGEETERMNGCM